MNKKSIAPIIMFMLLALFLSISTTVFALPDESFVQQSSLPQITFLGQGPQTFTVEPPLKLLVKTYENGQFLFVAHDELSYTAEANERVWTIDEVPSESIRLFDEERSYGNVEAGCVVNYVQIEDNIDNRRNTFYINGNVLQVVEQGWVTYGSFIVPEAGELTFFAEDSIGMLIELCQTAQTVVPSESPTVDLTPTGTITFEISTPSSTVTGTAVTPTQVTPSPSATITLTPTSTSTAPGIVITQTPSETPPTETITTTSTPGLQTPSVTNTPDLQTPTVTNTPGLQTPSVTSTPGLQTPSATAAAVVITATPRSTVGAFPVTGAGPGPREIATISISILGLFLLVGAAWWFLIRAYAQKR